MKKIFLLQLLITSLMFAQLKITTVEKISIPGKEQWSNPVFSPDGKEIYFTNTEFNGIWQYSFATTLLKEITKDPKSGYNFSISDDGSSIAYRRTFETDNPLERKQEAIILELATLSSKSIGSGNDIAVPLFVNNIPVFKNLSRMVKSNSPVYPTGSTKLIGIEDTKIALLENGVMRTLDPLGNGSYIWPQISPGKSKIVAVEMERGAFISNIDGTNIVRIGKCNAPLWSRNGKWIIGMDDKDDGSSIMSSEIVAVSIDGTKRIQLTDTPNVLEMFPSVSSVENKIVVCTQNGELLLLTYEEGK